MRLIVKVPTFALSLLLLAVTAPLVSCSSADESGSESLAPGQPKVSAGSGDFLKSENYAKTYQEKILPFHKINSQTGSVLSKHRDERGNAVKLAYRVTNPGRPKALFVLPGQSETYLKYNEFAYEFARQGYTIYQMDMRGQGFSSRLSDVSPFINHLDSFSFAVSDFSDFVNNVQSPHSEIRFFAHSTGGAILTRYLQEDAHSLPANVKAKLRSAVMSAPLFGIDTGKNPGFAAWALTALKGFLGKGDGFAPNSGPMKLDEPHGPGSGTSDPVRSSLYKGLMKQNKEAVSGGPSNRWVSEMFASTRKNIEHSSKVVLPVQLFQAEKDTFVLPLPQEEFCKKAKNCTLVRVEGSRHEIFNEVDAYRLKEFEAMRKFFQQH